VGGARETLDSLGCTAVPLSHRPEHGVAFIEWDLMDVQLGQTAAATALSCATASTNHARTMFGSISNTRAVPRLPRPAARHAMTRTRRSGEERVPCKIVA
jgi:hypothetical protein